MTATNAANEILIKEGYLTQEAFIKDSALIIALSKIEQYQAECDFFNHKHNMEVKEFEQHLHQEKGMEDFKKEEDLEDWEFTLSALKWWKEKANELRIS